MKTIKELKLTDLEQRVVIGMADLDEYNDMACGGVEDIHYATDIEVKSLRGVLSSLAKKGVMEESEFPDGSTAHHLVNEYNFRKVPETKVKEMNKRIDAIEGKGNKSMKTFENNTKQKQSNMTTLAVNKKAEAIQNTINKLNKQLAELEELNNSAKNHKKVIISSDAWCNESTISTLQHHTSKLNQINLIK